MTVGHGNHYDVDGQSLDERWPDADNVASIGGPVYELKTDGGQIDQTLTPTGWAVNLDNGHNGICFEWVRGRTMCGECFDPTAVDREWYDGAPESRDDPHATQCFDCHNWSAAARDASKGQTANLGDKQQ